ncbi:MAG: flagellar biosynthetic protein FliO [Armatimonadota bacterium]
MRLSAIFCTLLLLLATSTASICGGNTLPKVGVKAVSYSAPSGWGNSPQARPDKIASLNRAKEIKKEPRPSGMSVGTALVTLLKLLMVLALAYATILALKLLSGKRGGSTQSSGNLRVIDAVNLTQNNSLHLVNLKGKTLLVGCASGQVNLLQEFEEEMEPAPAPENKFAEYLARYSQGGEKSPASRLSGLLRESSAYLRRRGRIDKTDES